MAKIKSITKPLSLEEEIAAFEAEQIARLAAGTCGGAFTVELKSVGNPDYYQDPDEPMYGVPDIRAHVADLREASAICRRYIEIFDLGAGNWAGGEVVRISDGLVIGNVSYNGRVWDGNGSEVAL